MRTNIMKFYQMSSFILISVVLQMIPLVGISYADIIIGERLNINGRFSFEQRYSDNIYKEEEHKTDNYQILLSPGFDLEFAFSKQLKTTLSYSGIFDTYNNLDNFIDQHHYGGLELTYTSAKKSHVSIGTLFEDSAKQPHSLDDNDKPFSIFTVFTDIDIKVATSTQIFSNFQHNIRFFKNDQDSIDDYYRDYISIGFVNTKLLHLPFLLEYRYENQNNSEVEIGETKFNHQSVYTGLRWGKDRRLSGSLRMGYLWSSLNNSKIFESWATDSQLSYKLGSFTDIKLTLLRTVRESTRTDRESQDYFIFDSAKIEFLYTRFSPIQIKCLFGYSKKEFESINQIVNSREDEFYSGGLSVLWQIRKWLFFDLGYLHGINNSNVSVYDYVENLAFLKISFATTEPLR